MRVSARAVESIKGWEGWRAKAYRDVVGIWTIGYGHTSAAGPPKVQRGLVISEAEGESILRRDLQAFEVGVANLLKHKPTQGQFDGMVSLSFNIGLGAFKKSTCLRRYNAGDMQGAAEALTWFNKAGGKVYKGLVRRRTVEARWFRDTAPVIVNPPDKPAKPNPPPPEKVGHAPFVLFAIAAAIVGAVVFFKDKIKRMFRRRK